MIMECKISGYSFLKDNILTILRNNFNFEINYAIGLCQKKRAFLAANE